MDQRRAFENLELSHVQFTYVLPATKARDAKVLSIARALEGEIEEAGVPSRISGSLLPGSETDRRFFLAFHIERVAPTASEGKEAATKPSYLVSVVYRPQPRSPPPEFMTNLRGQGRTLEWMSDQLAKLAGRSEPAVYVSIEGRLRHSGQFPPVAAPPLTSGSNLLEFSGVEYRAKRLGEDGLRKFRWAQEAEPAEGFNVWLDYLLTSLPSSDDPVKTERDRCIHYLRELL